MNLLNNLAFKNKLVLLMLVPLLATLYFSLNSLNYLTSQKNKLSEVKQLISLTVVNNALVHELQKERGATALYIGSRGSKFTDELKAQRKLTDNAHSNLKKELVSFSSDNKKLMQIITAIESDLSGLANIRNQSDTFSIPLSEAITYYTKQNHNMLSLTSFFSSLSPTETVKNAISYYNFLEAKERAGIERAVVSASFASDKFTSALFQKFTSLVALQDSYLETFTLKASLGALNSYNNALNSDAMHEVNRMRKIAISTGPVGPFNIDAGVWFKHATTRINLLKETENILADEFITEVENLLQSASTEVIVDIVIIIITFAITLIIAFLILNTLLKQLKEISSTMEIVARDNNLSIKTKVLSNDELGDIAKGLNKTLMTFSSAITEIKESSISLAKSALQSSETVDTNVENLQQQRDEIVQVATAMEEMSTTVQLVSQNASDAMLSTHQVNKEAIESQVVVADSLHTIHNLASEVSDVGSVINNLHATTSNISSVIDVIKGIADQTNLLALNAAIEAARAGEQGRGFAVVADEVRSLSQRTQKSTVEIENIINQLQNEVNDANTSVLGTQKRASESITSAQKIESALTNIVTSVSNTHVMIEQIATATEEQVSVTEVINLNVNDIDQKSENITAGAKKVSEAAGEQVGIANKLKELAIKFVV